MDRKPLFNLNKREAKFAGVCAGLGDRFGVDPTFVRIGWVAFAILVSWKVALIAYIVAGIVATVQRKRSSRAVDDRSEFEKMADIGARRPSIHAMRTELDPIDRRLMAIDDHLAKPNDDLAREIEALKEDE